MTYQPRQLTPANGARRVASHPVGAPQFDLLQPWKRVRAKLDTVVFEDETIVADSQSGWVTYECFLEHDGPNADGGEAGTTMIRRAIEKNGYDSNGNVIYTEVEVSKARAAWEDRETAEYIPINRDTFGAYSAALYG